MYSRHNCTQQFGATCCYFGGVHSTGDVICESSSYT